jgi:hypothetical protein
MIKRTYSSLEIGDIFKHEESVFMKLIREDELNAYDFIKSRPAFFSENTEVQFVPSSYDDFERWFHEESVDDRRKSTMGIYLKEQMQHIQNSGIRKAFQWFIEDIKSFLFCLRKKDAFESLKRGELVHLDAGETHLICRFSGIGYYGFSDGMLPQFSVFLEETVEDEEGVFVRTCETSPRNIKMISSNLSY